jgi:hypothetical protein
MATSLLWVESSEAEAQARQFWASPHIRRRYFDEAMTMGDAFFRRAGRSAASATFWRGPSDPGEIGGVDVYPDGVGYG